MTKSIGASRAAKKSGKTKLPRKPERGDILRISFNPQAGSEQSGDRPCLVVSATTYNEKSSLCLVCPITSSAKPWPFHVPLPAGLKTKGFVIADQIRSLDVVVRNATLIEQAPDAVLEEVLARLYPLLFDNKAAES
jgi:mRNA interferase MazF